MAVKISVVMSVFNGAPFLEGAVDSILQQTFSDFEFIIIDDCSTDNSFEILQKISNKDTRIRLYQSEKNIGVAGFIKNLNRGIALARGEFIARMDHDDISSANRFWKQTNYFYQNPEVDFISAQLKIIDENGQEKGKLIPPRSDAQIKAMMPKQVSVYHPALMFRNKGYKYREKMLYCEDYDLYLNAISTGAKFGNVDTPLLLYRIHGNSMSRKNKFVRNLFVEKSREFYREKIKTGRDSYADFHPDIFTEILFENKNTDKEVLEFGLKTALKFNNKDEFRILLQKAKRNGITFKMIETAGLLPPNLRRVILNLYDRHLH